MGGLLVALVPILEGLLGGSSVGSVLGGLTLAQWVSIAGAVLNLAEPEIEPKLKTDVEGIFRAHPILSALLDDVRNFGPQVAAQNAFKGVAAFGYESPNNPGIFN